MGGSDWMNMAFADKPLGIYDSWSFGSDPGMGQG